MTEENFDNLPVTKGDLKNFATKDDLKNFATKDDLKNFATKDDLKNFATKDDFQHLSGKIDTLGEDLKGFKSEVLASFKELGEAIHLFATHVDKRFDTVESDVGTLKHDVTKIKSTMVTKDYLDEKLADQRGDLTVLVRKEDNKVKALVEVLVEKKVLDQADQKRIYSLEPFAQL